MSDTGEGRKEDKPNGRRRADIISAIDHPLRRRILRLLIRGDDEVLSPVQIARELDQPLGTVAYHVRILAHFHAVTRAGRKQVRGAVQRFYRTTIEDDPPVETLLEETEEVDEESGGKRKRRRKKR